MNRSAEKVVHHIDHRLRTAFTPHETVTNLEVCLEAADGKTYKVLRVERTYTIRCRLREPEHSDINVTRVNITKR